MSEDPGKQSASGVADEPPLTAWEQEDEPLYESVRMARVDVVSVERRVISSGKTTALIVVLTPVVLFLALSAAYYSAPSSERL